ncbi:hypothetical protein ANCCAN_07326 [Ancylostoma caninum]|uniref:Uncharacterized protein n=1 Tax=Ancylostoma caninum TaxID=29170 RepID=A0A368GUP2_ANCCA|nr:hypothetical protein ANCCAN_07326 [Ancylostoma caninum]
MLTEKSSSHCMTLRENTSKTFHRSHNRVNTSSLAVFITDTLPSYMWEDSRNLLM